MTIAILTALGLLDSSPHTGAVFYTQVHGHTSLAQISSALTFGKADAIPGSSKSGALVIHEL